MRLGTPEDLSFANCHDCAAYFALGSLRGVYFSHVTAHSESLLTINRGRLKSDHLTSLYSGTARTIELKPRTQ